MKHPIRYKKPKPLVWPRCRGCGGDKGKLKYYRIGDIIVMGHEVCIMNKYGLI